MWHETKYSSPQDGEIVETKIEDANGIRNEQKLMHKTSIPHWWTTDGEMYVYYTPTHWKRVTK